MWKYSFVSGVVLIALSGILFTMERFIAVFKYIGESFPVKIKVSGSFQSYPTTPTIPGIFDNIFVGSFFILGLILLIIGISMGYKEVNQSFNKNRL